MESGKWKIELYKLYELSNFLLPIHHPLRLSARVFSATISENNFFLADLRRFKNADLR